MSYISAVNPSGSDTCAPVKVVNEMSIFGSVCVLLPNFPRSSGAINFTMTALQLRGFFNSQVRLHKNHLPFSLSRRA